MRSMLLLLSPLMLMACQQADSAPAVNPVAAAAEAPAVAQTPGAQDTTDPADTEVALPPQAREMVKLAAAMTAMTEFCGLAKSGETDAALESLKREATTQGGSAAEVEQVYRGSLEEAKARASRDPAKAQKSCAQMRQLGDPDQIKKLQQAAAELEAKLKAQGR
ncbi:hypothetical protein [Luteimonas sp. e5]